MSAREGMASILTENGMPIRLAESISYYLVQGDRLALARAMVADMPFSVVPAEPTTAMVVAAIERPDTSDNGNGLFYGAIYRAMIAAAQEKNDE